MSRKDAVLLASRTLLVFLIVWVLDEISYLPEVAHSFLYYLRYVPSPSTRMEYLDYQRHYYLIRLAFLVTRIIGFSLMAMWIHKGSPEIENLLLPAAEEIVN